LTALGVVAASNRFYRTGSGADKAAMQRAAGAARRSLGPFP